MFFRRQLSVLGSFLIIGFLVDFGFLITRPACAQSPRSVSYLWLVLASQQNAEDAIALARYFQDGGKTYVVSTKNGWHAVVNGPYVASDSNALLEAATASRNLPKDTRVSDGHEFKSVTWRPSSSAIMSVRPNENEEVKLDYEKLIVAMDTKVVRDGLRVPRITATFDDIPAFEFTVPYDLATETIDAELSLHRLDPSAGFPQFVFTYFTGGRHCCTITKIASRRESGEWFVIDAETLDGSGYQFEDLQSDGITELIGSDDRFLYQFSSYAESNPPVQIFNFVAGRLENRTTNRDFQPFLRQQVFQRNYQRRMMPDIVNSNGFLAGWLASNILIGEGTAAWATVLSSYDRESDWGLETCTLNMSLTTCPEDKRKKIDFPDALIAFLEESGYPTSGLTRVSEKWDRTGSDPRSLIEACTNHEKTVRTLILGALIGKPGLEPAMDSFVTLRDDVTVEASNDRLGVLTCAVTFDANVRAMMVKAAELKQLRVANAITHIARRRGPVFSQRIRFTVQPTSDVRRSWIKLVQ